MEGRGLKIQAASASRKTSTSVGSLGTLGHYGAGAHVGRTIVESLLLLSSQMGLKARG